MRTNTTEIGECMEYIASTCSKTKAITIIAHGLNNKPSTMQKFTDALTSHGSDVIAIKLSGHRGDYESLNTITRNFWLSELQEAFTYAQEIKEDRSEMSIYFLGYSIGALLNLDLISSHPSLIHCDKMVLFAPANGIKWTTYLIKVAFILGNQFRIPSLTPKTYRANAGVPVNAYKVLFESKKTLENNNYNSLNIPTIIFVDPKDETVGIKNLERIKKRYLLSNWNIHALDSDEVKANGKYHHLIIDQNSMGQNNWNITMKRILYFLLNE